MFVAVASLTIVTILGMSIQRFVYFQQQFTNISVPNSENDSSSGFDEYSCSKWTCTNDFIFTVVLVLNIGKVPCKPQLLTVKVKQHAVFLKSVCLPQFHVPTWRNAAKPNNKGL